VRSSLAATAAAPPHREPVEGSISSSRLSRSRSLRPILQRDQHNPIRARRG
jgi:hypothetical protein